MIGSGVTLFPGEKEGNMGNKTVSIIVPVYNAEKTLERCVRSLMAQTYGDIEILLVNDGSRDQSLAICQRLAQEDGRIRLIDKPNGGVSSARNAGLDAARGDYVMFCDSDDWVEPDWCECLVSNCGPGDMAICESDRADLITEHDADTEEAERRELLHYPLLASSLWNKLFLRSVIEEAGLRFDEKLRLGEDLCFVLAYLCLIDGKLRFLYRPLYHYDVSTVGSLSKKAPSLEQCDTFCQLITASMETLEATDPRSVGLRDKMVIHHFERLLEQTAQNAELPLTQKMRIAGEVGRLESFRQCRCGFREDRNPIYLRLLWAGRTKLLMAFLLLRQKKQEMCKK